MSVINKMLRDLDARPSRSQTDAAHAFQGTMTLALPVSPRRAGMWLLVGVGLLIPAWWWGLSSSTAEPAPTTSLHWVLEMPAVQVQAVPPGPQPEGSQDVPREEIQEEVLEATRKPGVAIPISAMPKLSDQLPVPGDVKSAAPQKVSESLRQIAPMDVAMKKEATALTPLNAGPPNAQVTPPIPTQSATPIATSTAASIATPSAPITVPITAAITATPSTASAVSPVTVNRQLALQENLQQAQQLWQAGSRDAALDVLRATLQSAERSKEPTQSAEYMTLLREWARMALALGRAAEVMALVSKHAAQLQAQPEIWALQGQAAQRLGQHAEAVEAYNHALNNRPNEARWLLASAVSYAASGQTDAAARQLQRARAQGPVNPEILAYLKQAGVALP